MVTSGGLEKRGWYWYTVRIRPLLFHPYGCFRYTKFAYFRGMVTTVEQKLEAVLFFSGEAETRDRLARLLDVSLEELDTAVRLLTASLASRGIRLLAMNEQLELVTAPETSDVVTRVRKQELARDLGKAGNETMAIILYRGLSTRAEIEYVRGVNCAFVLRNLLIRGLIERVHHETRARTMVYRATPEALEHLGITRIEDLPEYTKVRAELARFEAGEDTASRDSGGPQDAPGTTGQ